MCGICGIIKRNHLEPEDHNIVRRMNSALIHRGPDSEGYFSSKNLSMGMRRLSIIDLEGGDQPIYNEDRSLALIVNGEIYNYQELTDKLVGMGHVFKTQGDCETIIHLYEQYGEDCVHHLRGMFAFAVWDSRKNTLFLARDRMGEKPLYLHRENDSLLFSSEMKSLLSSGTVPFELDPIAVNLFFSCLFIPEPRTILQDVYKIDAGHWLKVNVSDWTVQEKRYWNLEDAEPLDGDPVDLIRHQLEEISKIVVKSDVPVGVALSGGLDSSAIAVLAAKEYPGKIHAFTVGYEGSPENDERKDACCLAKQLDIPFHEIEVTQESMVKSFPELVKAQDDPIADIAAHGYQMLSRKAREMGVPVLLQGQGGDELFWGYPWVRDAVRETLLKSKVDRYGAAVLPSFLKPCLPEGMKPWQMRRWLQCGMGLKKGLARYRKYRDLAEDQMIFFEMISGFNRNTEVLQSLYTDNFRDKLGDHKVSDLYSYAVPWPDVGVKMTSLITDTYLRENGIAQGDRLSMASSVEMRLPLVDYKLEETVVGLRKRRSDLNLEPKFWLKSVLKDIIPGEDIISRPKRGFTPPVEAWINALVENYGEELKGGFLQSEGVLSEKSISAILSRRLTVGPMFSFSYRALVLEYWCRAMLDKCAL